jgi:shikimate kinase
MEQGTGNNALDKQTLVLISGPVASGKTTTAWMLAKAARELSLQAASIDMDEMVEMIAGSDWSLITEEDRRRACRATSGLVDQLLDSGVVFIAIAGSTLSQYEWDEVLQSLNRRPRVFLVLLHVSLEEASRRTKDDPDRIKTKDRSYLTQLDARTNWKAIRQHDVELETDGIKADEVSARIAVMVFE